MRHRLGDWTCPSGNNVVVFYHPLRDGLAIVEIEWDDPPPLSPADETYYLDIIRPALAARLREYTETTGRTMVVTL